MKKSQRPGDQDFEAKGFENRSLSQIFFKF